MSSCSALTRTAGGLTALLASTSTAALGVQAVNWHAATMVFMKHHGIFEPDGVFSHAMGRHRLT